MKLSATKPLPRLSRSTFCATAIPAQPACRRLTGHKGDCRSTLSAPKGVLVIETPKAGLTRRAKARKAAKLAARRPVEVRSSDVYTVLPTELAYEAPKTRIGVSGTVGQHRTARRAPAAPADRRAVTIAEETRLIQQLAN